MVKNQTAAEQLITMNCQIISPEHYFRLGILWAKGHANNAASRLSDEAANRMSKQMVENKKRLEGNFCILVDYLALYCLFQLLSKSFKMHIKIKWEKICIT